MTRKRKNPWEVYLNCPFCGKEVASTFDYNEYPKELSVDDFNDGCSQGIYACEHVAFSGVWGFAGFTIENRWQAQINQVIKTCIMKGWIKSLDDDAKYDESARLQADVLL